MNLTIRNIPDNVINKIRTLSQMEDRSLNNEILFVLERGVQEKLQHSFDIKRNINKDNQIKIWMNLSHRWQDDRTTDEIISDIYNSRTLGREFQL